MKFGVYCANYGSLSEPRLLCDLGVRAEAAGWDGFFVYDHIVPKRDRVEPAIDPWTVLAAVAVDTRHLRLGPMVTAVARRQPWELAHQAVALDRLSAGRLTLGVGLGAPGDLRTMVPDLTPVQVGERLDEGLELLDQLLAGRQIDHSGSWRLDRMAIRPGPWDGRIPIWVGGGYGAAKPARRAARYDGYFPIPRVWDGLHPATVEGLAESMKVIRTDRGSLDGYDIVTGGVSPIDPDAARAAIGPYASLGATWWLEVFEPVRAPVDAMIARIDAGPLP